MISYESFIVLGDQFVNLVLARLFPQAIQLINIWWRHHGFRIYTGGHRCLIFCSHCVVHVIPMSFCWWCLMLHSGLSNLWALLAFLLCLYTMIFFVIGRVICCPWATPISTVLVDFAALSAGGPFYDEAHYVMVAWYRGVVAWVMLLFMGMAQPFWK